MFLQNEYEWSGAVRYSVWGGNGGRGSVDMVAVMSSQLRFCGWDVAEKTATVPDAAVYNLDEADVEGQRKRFELYNEVRRGSAVR